MEPANLEFVFGQGKRDPVNYGVELLFLTLVKVRLRQLITGFKGRRGDVCRDEKCDGA